MTRIKIVIAACTATVIPACSTPLRHPRMLLSGDLLIKLFERSQTVWEIPDEYCVFSGMTRIKIVIPACHTPRHPRMPTPSSSPHAPERGSPYKAI
jgi:hypothetical protein